MANITSAILLLGLALQPASVPPDGPRNRRVSIATSDDGLAFTSQGAIAERVGKPDVIELAASTPKPGLAKGDWYLVAIDGRDDGRDASCLCALRSTDGGTTWGAPTSVQVADWPGSWTARTCSVVQLADARLRVYIEVDATRVAPAPADPGRPIGIPPNVPVHPSLPTPPKKPEFPERPGQPRTNMPFEEVSRRIVSAVSEDGASFVLEPGDRLEGASFSDPDVVRVGDAWMLFLNRGQDIALARSNDGLSFTIDATFAIGGWREPAAALNADGRVRLVGVTRDGVVSGLVDPASGAFEREPGWRATRPASDPALASRAAGGYLMVYATPISQPSGQDTPGSRQ